MKEINEKKENKLRKEEGNKAGREEGLYINKKGWYKSSEEK